MTLAKKHRFVLKKFVQSNMKTCYNQRVVATLGQKIKKSDILAEGPAAKGGEFGLGS